jgi:hypothetical protein
LLVKVMARISNGDTPCSMRWAMRWVSTRVLPEPAPAMTSSGPSVVEDRLALDGVQALEELGVGGHGRHRGHPTGGP